MDGANKDKQFLSIRTELIFWFLLLSLLPISAISILSYQQAKKVLVESAINELFLSSKSNSRFINNWFNYRFMEIKHQANEIQNIEFLQKLNSGLEKNQLDASSFIESIQWKKIIETVPNELTTFIEQYDYIYNVRLTNTNGDILYSLKERDDLGMNLLSGSYSSSRFAKGVQENLNTARSLLTDLDLYIPSNNGLSTFLIESIKNSEQQVIGTISIQIKLDRIFNLVNNPQNKSIQHYIMTNNRVLQSHNNLIKYSNYQKSSLTKLKDEEILDNRRKIISYSNLDNETIIRTKERLALENVDWFLISEVKESDVIASATWIRDAIVLITLIVILFTIAIAVYIARRITNPISKLVEATQNVASGELEFQINITRKNEIGRLAETFNKMIFKRRLYEHNLHASHQRITKTLRELAQQKYALDQHAIVSITDIEGKIIYVNDKLCAISGYLKNELIGKNNRILKSNIHDNAFFKHLYQTITNGFVWHGEICNRSKKGRLYWVDTTIIPFMNDNNSPQSYIAIRTDITNLKMAQEKLIKSEENLLAAQKTAAIGHYEYKINVDTWSCSEELQQIFGINKNYKKNISSWLQLVHPEYKSLVYESIKILEPNGSLLYDIEYIIICQETGKEKWVHAIGKLKHDQYNKPLEIFGTVQDISHRKKMEIALQRAQRMEAIGQLTGGIAHDFNNILGIIIGNLDMLDAQLYDNEKAQKRISSASKAALRAENLTKQLLGFSRRQTTKNLQSNINQIIKQMDEVFLQSVGKEIKISYHFENKLWLTRIDRGDLQDSLLNLVLNAKDAIKKTGYIKIETKNIYINNEMQNKCPALSIGEYVVISLSDSGMGISEEIQRNIFEPFFTTKAQGKGTGLGLSMVFGFVKRSKGYIDVTSTQGKGSRFDIYLPRDKHSNQISPPLPKLDNKTQSLLGNESILVVDDEEGLIEITRKFLEEFGYQVYTVTNANMALEFLSENNSVDLLFSDILMPGEISGLDLANTVVSEYPSIRILLTSGFSGNKGNGDNQDNNQFTILHKPYNQKNLLQKIRLILDGNFSSN